MRAFPFDNQVFRLFLVTVKGCCRFNTVRTTWTTVVLLSKSRFASSPFACFCSYKAAACFAENHSFPLYLLRNKNPPKLSAEHPQGRTSAHKLPLELEESKYHSCLHKGQAERLMELQAGQSHLSTWEGDKANNPGKHFQTYKGQEGHWG